MSTKKLPPVAPNGYEWIKDCWKPIPKKEKAKKETGVKERKVAAVKDNVKACFHPRAYQVIKNIWEGFKAIGVEAKQVKKSMSLEDIDFQCDQIEGKIVQVIISATYGGRTCVARGCKTGDKLYYDILDFACDLEFEIEKVKRVLEDMMEDGQATHDMDCIFELLSDIQKNAERAREILFESSTYDLLTGAVTVEMPKIKSKWQRQK